MHDGGGFSGGHDGGGFGGHHGGGFGGHHHGGGSAGHHHHHQQNQGDPSGLFLPTGNVRPRATGLRLSAARYLGFGAFLVVFVVCLVVLLIVAH